MKFNWKIRLQNPIFLLQITMAILLPILAYMGLTVQDLTTWGKVIEVILKAVQNPYVIGLCCLSVWNAINNPTTRGLGDSERM